jgi:hypothetical protein
MTSLMRGIKQNSTDGGYFINVGDLRGLIYQHTGSSNNNTGTNGGTFSTATWAFSTTLAAVPGGFAAFSTTLARSGQAVLRDMGRTVVSSNRTFRKIQYVVPHALATSTFGVGGQATNVGENYLTGFIELGLGGETPSGWVPTPVAHFGR